MLVTLVVTHGFGPKMLAATLGTTAALILTLGLGSLFVGAAHLTGLSSDEAIFIRASVGEISITGLLLAGMVIGALGVLDDLTVTQASTVLALRRGEPGARIPAALRGRDQRRPRSHRSDREHARARLCRRRAAGAPDLQPRRHLVRGRPEQRGGGDRGRGDACRLDRPDRRRAADDGARCSARRSASRPGASWTISTSTLTESQDGGSGGRVPWRVDGTSASTP